MSEIIDIDFLRYKANIRKICKCEGAKYELDTVNRLVYCIQCGAIIDPFEALKDLAYRSEEINEKTRQIYEQQKQLANYKPYLKEAKRYEQMMRETKMIPICPNCKKPFNWNEITTMINKEFLRKEIEEYD